MRSKRCRRVASFASPSPCAATRSRSRSATPARVSRRTTSPTCSNPSSRPSRRVPASDSPSCIASSRNTAGTSTSGARRAWVRRSPSPYPSAMPDTRVLIVDDERSMRELLAIMLKQAGHEVTVAEGGEQAIEVIKSESFDLVITDLRMRRVDGIAVLRAAKEHSPSTVVLVVTAFASTETAVEAMKLGAYDYVTKPFKLDEIKLTIANALERKRLQDENRELRFESFVGKSRQMVELLEVIRKTADGLSTVMVTGESGTGKELVAQAIHQGSPSCLGT